MKSQNCCGSDYIPVTQFVNMYSDIAYLADLFSILELDASPWSGSVCQ